MQQNPPTNWRRTGADDEMTPPPPELHGANEITLPDWSNNLVISVEMSPKGSYRLLVMNQQGTNFNKIMSVYGVVCYLAVCLFAVICPI